MQPSAPASPIAPTATTTAAPAYKPLQLDAYDRGINVDANQSSGDIQRAMSQFESTKANPIDVYNKAVENLGIGDVRGRVVGLRNQLLNTENLLNNVEGSVNGRTQGSLVTEAQRQRLVNLERAPIMKDYGTLSGSLTNEQANLSDLNNQAQTATNLALEGQKSRQEAIQFALDQATSREKATEDARRFAEQMALQRAQEARLAATAKAQSAGLSLPNLGSGNGLPSEPKQAVGQLFSGYNPTRDKGYTEQVVIPELVSLMRSQPGYKGISDAALRLTAMQVAYDYRKQVFGE